MGLVYAYQIRFEFQSARTGLQFGLGRHCRTRRDWGGIYFLETFGCVVKTFFSGDGELQDTTAYLQKSVDDYR